MLASALTAITALTAASALALPRAISNGVEPRQRKPFANWPAMGYEQECTGRGCVATFSITAAPNYVRDSLGFDVLCRATYNEGWSVCEAPDGPSGTSRVKAQWTEASASELIKISVDHVSSSNGTRVDASGSVEFGPGTLAFVVPVTSWTAVA